MGLLKTNEMTQPIPDPVDWTKIIEIVCSLLTVLIAWVYFVNRYFKNKAQEKEDWIKSIATIAVNSAMDSCLKDVRNDIQVLFKYREADRLHIDNKFDAMMTEVRKP